MHIPAVRSFFVALLIALSATISAPASAAGKGDLERASKAALNKLVGKVPAAGTLNGMVVAVLVFPSITKAGFVVGGQFGDGVLWRGGKAVGYYSTTGASYGLQAGAQKCGYAMFFMNEQAPSALNTGDGFEVGVGPGVVLVDEGMAKSATTTTAQNDIYAFIFGQTGLMARLGIQGN